MAARSGAATRASLFRAPAVAGAGAIRRFACAAIGLLLLLTCARAAAADERVGVLPFLSVDGETELYEKAVAGAVSTGLARATGVDTVLVKLKSPPEGLTLVVDGKIVSSGEEVVLEASLRDPQTGERSKRAVTSRRSLDALDDLAAELVALLAPMVRAEIAARRAARDLATVATAGGSGGGADRDALVVSSLSNAKLEVDRAPVVARQFARRLGLRWIDEPMPADGTRLLTEARKRNATWAITLGIDELQVKSFGLVPTARGVVEVKLFDRDGNLVYRKAVSTGTVVGNRMDGHLVLLRLLGTRVLDIVLPDVRKITARGR